DLCYFDFFAANPMPDRPWPPADQPDGTPTLPPQFICGAQRPSANMTPAIGRDGTIYTASLAVVSEFYSFAIALNPDLTVKWSTSLRDHLANGCGVNIPYGTGPNDCRIGARLGIDPLTNLPPAMLIDDTASSSPVALPDGGVLIGTLDTTNGGRG